MAVMTNSGRVGISFAIEFHQLINVANVFVTISNPENLTDILITKKCIQISIRNSDRKKDLRQCRFEMSTDTFIPPSTSGLSVQYFKLPEEYDADSVVFKSKPWTQAGPLELTFRIHINDDVFLDDNDKQLITSQSEFPIKIQSEYDFLCRSCKNPLNRTPLVFKRVLEKPSSDWQDLASEWFCHRHGDSDGVPTGLRQTDLMFSSRSIFLHPDLISFKEGNNKSTVCNRCESHVGFLSESRLLHEANPLLFSELITNTVLLKPCDEILVPEEQEAESAVETVVKLIREQMEPIMMCKLCLESKGVSECSGSLLLWVMENMLRRFHVRCTLTADSQTIPVKPEKVMKVLYSVTDGSSALADKWRKDFSVETQPMDDCTIWTAVSHLIDSTETLPSTHRMLDDLWVGFLPLGELATKSQGVL